MENMNDVEINATMENVNAMNMRAAMGNANAPMTNAVSPLFYPNSSYFFASCKESRYGLGFYTLDRNQLSFVVKSHDCGS